MGNDHIKQAENAVREQEELDVAIIKQSQATADYFNNLVENGVSEAFSLLLTLAWMGNIKQ